MKTFLLILIFLALSDNLVIDSNMSFQEATKNTKAPDELLSKLVLLNINYFSFDSKTHKGQIIVNQEVEADVKEVFNLMFENKFPIKQMKPIVAFNWDDNTSMEDNNTSAFNYRFVAGTDRLSNHSFGRAIDINPRMNPVYYSDGKISPKNGTRDTTKAGTFHKDHFVVKEFKKRGWRWGGDWTSLKDYHHFDKPE